MRKMETLFARARRDRTRRNGFKLREIGFSLDIRKKLFAGWVDGEAVAGCPELWMPHPWKCSRPGWKGL